jgi:hypothetical protein
VTRGAKSGQRAARWGSEPKASGAPAWRSRRARRAPRGGRQSRSGTHAGVRFRARGSPGGERGEPDLVGELEPLPLELPQPGVVLRREVRVVGELAVQRADGRAPRTWSSGSCRVPSVRVVFGTVDIGRPATCASSLTHDSCLNIPHPGASSTFSRSPSILGPSWRSSADVKHAKSAIRLTGPPPRSGTDEIERCFFAYSDKLAIGPS